MVAAIKSECLAAMRWNPHHAFQKKSKRGIKTPKAEIDLLKARLKWAEERHAEWLEGQKGSEHG